MNTYKNERIIKIGEAEFLLRPTFENCAALEGDLKMGLNALAFKLAKAELPLNTDCVKVIYHCQVSDKKLTKEEIWMLCFGSWIDVMKEVLMFIGSITAGDNTQVEKKAQPQASIV